MSLQHQSPEQADDSSTDRFTYQCPYCEEEYGNEILARTHVTRSEDSDHINRNGFMPETEIRVIGDDGEVNRTESKRKADIDYDSLTVGDIPGEYNDQHKCIILAGAHNPYVDEYSNDAGTGMKSKADEILEEHGLDTLSYSTVRRVLRNFYRPQEVQAEKEQKRSEQDEEQLGDLTAKQQAIIIEKLADPDADDSVIAERINNISPSYPRQVYNDRAKDIYTRLKSQVDNGETVEETVLKELEGDDVKELRERGYDLHVDFEDAIESSEEVFDLGVDEQNGFMSASPYETAPPGQDQQDGQRDEEAPTQPAAVTDSSTDVDETQPDEETMPRGEGEEPSTSSPPSSISTGSEGDANLREEIEELREKVKWTIEVAEDEGESEARDRQLAFARKILDDIDTALDAA